MPSTLALSPRRDAWLCRCLAGLLILASAGLHLAYLAVDCPLDLAPDEAHYWDWSRHLDISYYSKGPLVAWLIRAGCVVAGDWSQDHFGNAMFAVRLPAVICGALLLVSLYILTVQVFGRERLAALVVAFALTLPLIVAGSTLMTIDSPFTCCWGWALVLGHRALFRGSAWAWPAAGLIVGIGILAKYTMVLWLGSVGLFLLASPTHRRLLLRPGFWIMSGVAFLCSLPILIWNMQHDWVTFQHVNGLAGMNDGPRIAWSGPLVYMGSQCGLLLVFWFLAWLCAMIVHRPTVERDDGIRYLWWLSVPTFVVFLLFSPKTGGGEVNWPVTTYISGLVLAIAWIVRQLQAPQLWYRALTAGFLTLTCAVGLSMSLLMHHSEQAWPLLSELTGPPSPDHPMPMRRFDPTCRLRGWRTLAREVDRVRADLEVQGVEPVLAGASWWLTGELGFYCADHPTVYSVGLALGDRRSQYDLWRPNPVWDPERFHGRTFIIVGDIGPTLREAFDHVEPSQGMVHTECGQPVACWIVTVCRGFRGFRPIDQLLQRRQF
ncbi:MAG: glycosyltransferase family 39 protein [Gemmataceae bacterium]|nr:glycosyltransferase family 39 protein [Gemmataceae bacterium]